MRERYDIYHVVAQSGVGGEAVACVVSVDSRG
jgi:hypothetical protein